VSVRQRETHTERVTEKHRGRGPHREAEAEAHTESYVPVALLSALAAFCGHIPRPHPCDARALTGGVCLCVCVTPRTSGAGLRGVIPPDALPENGQARGLVEEVTRPAPTRPDPTRSTASSSGVPYHGSLVMSC
jgi:hypothetical protein